MIKKLEIKNFKGIGDPGVEIEFKPITLLFGPNSAGKSSIIQAIHYAREIFLRKNFDPTSTLSGGSILNLGGFKNIVHNHNVKNTITLKFNLDLESLDLASGLQKYSTDESLESDFIEEKSIFENLCAGVFDAAISIDIKLNKDTDDTRAIKYKLDINGEPFIEIELDDKNPKDIHSFFSLINIKHSIIPEEITDDPPNSMFYAVTDTEADNFKLRLIEPQSVFTLENEGLRIDPQHFRRDSITFSSEEDGDEFFSYYITLLKSICRLIDVITDVLREDLNMFRYIGPLREIPSRNFIPESLDELSRWSNGIFAWDKLYNNKISVSEINKWLQKLKIEYSLVKVNQIEVDDSDLDNLKKADINIVLDKIYTILDSEPPKEKLFRDLKDLFIEHSNKGMKKPEDFTTKIYLSNNKSETKVLPSDLGVGISQVIPIVVGVLSCKQQFHSFLAIEQPELHIHPAIQVELADLFISLLNPPNEDTIRFNLPQFLIETHSEHLMLRFLRRIEETSQKKIHISLRLTPNSINVYWCESSDDGLKVDLLPIDETGEFTRQWPKGFFEERAEELFPDD